MIFENVVYKGKGLFSTQLLIGKQCKMCKICTSENHILFLLHYSVSIKLPSKNGIVNIKSSFSERVLSHIFFNIPNITNSLNHFSSKNQKTVIYSYNHCNCVLNIITCLYSSTPKTYDPYCMFGSFCEPNHYLGPLYVSFCSHLQLPPFVSVIFWYYRHYVNDDILKYLTKSIHFNARFDFDFQQHPELHKVRCGSRSLVQQ